MYYSVPNCELYPFFDSREFPEEINKPEDDSYYGGGLPDSDYYEPGYDDMY